MWPGSSLPYHALESFTVQPPTVLEISTVDFEYTVRFRPGISSSQIGRHHRALSDTTGNNLRLLPTPARFVVPVDDRWRPIALAQF